MSAPPPPFIHDRAKSLTLDIHLKPASRHVFIRPQSNCASKCPLLRPQNPKFLSLSLDPTLLLHSNGIAAPNCTCPLSVKPNSCLQQPPLNCFSYYNAMHTATQLLASRATPATRTKARFTPYNDIPSTSSFLASRFPATLYLNTPMPSVSSPKPPPQSVHQSCDPTRTRQLPHPTPSQNLKEPIRRDASKQKFAISLIS